MVGLAWIKQCELGGIRTNSQGTTTRERLETRKEKKGRGVKRKNLTTWGGRSEKSKNTLSWKPGRSQTKMET